MDRDRLGSYIESAAKAGLPEEQIIKFIEAGYVSLPWALEYHAVSRLADKEDGPYWILTGGARGPGKSHSALAQGGIDDCRRVPRLKLLFLRKIQQSAKESMDDLIYKVFRGVKYNYVKSDKTVYFPNGSRILIGGFRHEGDIEKYLGIEYDGAIVEELTQLSEDKIIRLRGSIRSTIPGWRTRIYASTNPGGIGHLWVKKNFVNPYREGNNGEHKFIGGRTYFIPANYEDNPFLKQDYKDYLIALPGDLGKAWREGDWDAFEGMAFPMWDYDRHTVPPFRLPEWWAKWRAVDWGFGAPFVCLWFAKDPDSGRIFIYRELYRKELTDKQQAITINSMTSEEENISSTYVDPKSFMTRKNLRGKISTAAQEYERYGVPVTKADNNRIAGKRRVNDVLADLPDGMPGLRVFNTLKNLIETLSSIPRSENNPEDVDRDSELDHPYDALRYGLTRYRKEEAEEETDPVQARKMEAIQRL